MTLPTEHLETRPIELPRNPRLALDCRVDGLIDTLRETRRRLRAPLADAAEAMVACFAGGGKVLACGNGGSAAEAQHLASELVGRFRWAERAALPALALGADAAVLTGWANDAGYDGVFARQVEAFGREGDLVVGVSTSGRSANVVRAFEAARERDLCRVALTGGDGGALVGLADISLVVPSYDTQHVQEVHVLLVHLLCELVEAELVATRLTWRTR